MSNDNAGLEYVQLYIPLNDETRLERKEIVADAAQELAAYDRQIKELKDSLKDAIKAAQKKKQQALLELRTGQYELVGDFISYVNEGNRTMEYYDPRPGHEGSLIASRPLSQKEIRQFKIDFREKVAQN